MPGDSVVAVSDQLSRVHRDDGGSASALVRKDGQVRFRYADNVEVDYRSVKLRWEAERWQRRVDIVAGFAGRTRPYYPDLYRPGIAVARTLQPDAVLVCESHYAAGSLPHWRAALPDCGLFLYAHVQLSRSYGRRELNRLLGLADGVIVVSDAMRSALQARLGSRTPVALHVVHNGVDLGRFRPPDSPRPTEVVEVLYAGRVIPEKGVQLLLDAFELATRRTRVPLRLRIVGSSGYDPTAELSQFERSLRTSAARCDGDAVVFEPFLDQDTLAARYRAASIVCVPSVCSEAFGLVVLEAMAAECAVVSSRAGGLVEAGGDVAVYLDPEDVEQFADGLVRLAEDPAARRDLGARGRQRAEEHSWERAYQQMRRIVDATRSGG
jgi:glycosyltransferase involved in cell wall biosynthesis